MLIGKGVIANRFLDYAIQSSYLVFAGSIHDSSIRDESLLQAEESALLAALKTSQSALLVYFSSCSILDPNESDSAYVKHKKRMEKIVEDNAQKYLIVRLPQILAFADEKSSLVNYLVDAILNDKTIQIWKKAGKNFIDIDDVYFIVQELLAQKQVLNRVIHVASPVKTSVGEMVAVIETYFGRKVKTELVDKGSSFDIPVDEIRGILSKLKIKFEPSYLRRSIDKYFRHLSMAPILLSVIVPTYNEEHGIEEFYRRTKDVLKVLEGRFNHEIIFVNDFSSDNTFEKLQTLAEKDSSLKLINFSRNFGNQIGITAGIDFSRGDIAVIIDDDLQDPPEVMLNFIAKWTEGFKVVYGVRPKRQGVNVFFKLLAKIYYRMINGLSETKMPNDTGDFRLVDRIVIENLRLMKEENRYYRGMVAWVGFSQFGCFYERDKRYAGVSTFSFKKYVNFALNGLTSFTDKPLYFSSLCGFIITCVGFFFACTIIVQRIIDPSTTVRGWTSIMAMTIFFGGIQLLSIGIVGIYLSKIFREVKGRPLYIVESTTNIDNPVKH